jgi:hypothetical protein
MSAENARHRLEDASIDLASTTAAEGILYPLSIVPPFWAFLSLGSMTGAFYEENLSSPQPCSIAGQRGSRDGSQQ